MSIAEDDEEDYVLSEDDEEEMPPDTLKKETPDKNNKSASAKMRSPEEQQGKSSAPPGSIENIISQVNNTSNSSGTTSSIKNKSSRENMTSKTPSGTLTRSTSGEKVKLSSKKSSKKLSFRDPPAEYKASPSTSNRDLGKSTSYEEKKMIKSDSKVNDNVESKQNDKDEYDMINDFEDDSVTTTTRNTVGVTTNHNNERKSMKRCRSIDNQATSKKSSGVKNLNNDFKASGKAKSMGQLRHSSTKSITESLSKIEVNQSSSNNLSISKTNVNVNKSPVDANETISVPSISPSPPLNNRNDEEKVSDDEYGDDENDFEDEEVGGKDGNNADNETAKMKSQDIANSVMKTPQKTNLSSNNEEQETDDLSLKQRKGKKGNKDVDYKNKIIQLEKKIREIAAEREKYSPTKKSKGKKKKLPKVQKAQLHAKPKSTAPKYVHSKLKFIMADVSISPYMTAPDASYSKKTLRLPEIIRSAKYEESNKQLPFDEKQMEDTFVNEIYNYKKRDMFR